MRLVIVKRSFQLGLVLATLLAPSARAENAVTGFVVDQRGLPVAGATVGSSFSLGATLAKTKVQIGYAQPPVLTDANGAFSIPADAVSYTKVLVAAKDNGIGFAVRYDTGPVRIKIGAPARLDVLLTKHFGDSAHIGLDLLTQNSAIGYAFADTGKSSFVVPQGSYDLGVSQKEITPVTKQLSFSGPQPQSIALELEPANWLKSLGGQAPDFTPTDLQNAKNVSISSMRGKWLLVDFWATWCLPCVQEMPKLISYYQAHADKRDKFEIIAVYATDAKSFADIKPAYDRLTATAWSGKAIPFPMVFDSTGATQKKWGVTSFPTTLLVDPQGKLVGSATIDDLAARVR